MHTHSHQKVLLTDPGQGQFYYTGSPPLHNNLFCAIKSTYARGIFIKQRRALRSLNYSARRHRQRPVTHLLLRSYVQLKLVTWHFQASSIHQTPSFLLEFGDRYCAMLSDKAKGKQRAVEPPSSVPDSQAPGALLKSNQAPNRDLVVRFTEGLPDLIVPVNQQDAVRDVKRKVNK